MTLRSLTIVALRILGLGLLLSALGTLVTLAYTIVELAGLVSPWSQQMVTGLTLNGLAVLVRAAIGIALFIWAANVSRLVCRDIPAEEASAQFTTIGAGDLYHIATFVMGVYFMARAVSPSARVIVGMMRAAVPSASADAVASFLEAALYIAHGLGLILGSRGISRFFATLGHDPDNVPAQQISLRVILVLVVGCAILLAITRFLAG